MTHIKKLVLHGFKSFARPTEIVFDKGLNCVAGPNGSGKSCHYDTLVTLTNGQEVQIGRLVEDEIENSNEIKKLDDGIYVNSEKDIKILSLNKENMKIEEKKISKFIKREGEIIFRIKTRSGKEVKATGCHPVMIFNRGEIKSTIIRNLKENEIIATPRIIRLSNTKEFSPELMRFIGYVIGDGYLAEDRIEFVNNDPEIIADYKKILKEYFKIDSKERQDKGINRIYFRDKIFVKKIKDLFYKDHKKSITSEIKKIPDEFLTAGNDSLKHLLQGLFDTDGSVRKDIAIIEFCTKNIDLAKQMQGLLLRFGILSKIKKRKCCAVNTVDKIKRDYHYLYIYGQENLKKFEKNISFKVEHKRLNLKIHTEKEVQQNPNVDLLPQETNLYVRELTKLLGIQIKPLREEYPFLLAYCENRCCPTRMMVSKIIPIFQEKLRILEEKYQNLKPNPFYLVECMNQLNMSGIQTSQQLGLQKQIIRDHWATGKFTPRPQNLMNFYNLIKETFTMRFVRIRLLLNLLKNIANSDIQWDEIVSIEQLPKEEWVYDISVEENHNFIANNIFVHNSNIPDAICFVLGRLSIKSMRASRASKLIYHGGKEGKPAQYAKVSMIFDNMNNEFSLPSQEIEISRIVKRDGNSVYKINNETKTRQEVLELLGQAGIDPDGFNIILQGQIDSIIRMPPEEKRQIIEEISGILVYETRKEKSLKELEKTETELKQVGTILNERKNYLSNLEKEREQALKYEQLQKDIRRCKASILNKKIESIRKDVSKTNKDIEEKEKSIEKLKQASDELRKKVQLNNERITRIEEEIEQKTGVEQEHLRNKVLELKTENAKLNMNREHLKDQLSNLDVKENSSKQEIERLKQEIKDLETKSNVKISSNEKTRYEEINKNIDEIKQKINELELKKERNHLHKNEISKKQALLGEKEKQVNSIKQSISELSREIANSPKIKRSDEDIKSRREEHQRNLETSQLKIKELEKEIVKLITRKEIEKKDIEEILKLNQCPKCKQIVSKEHKESIVQQIKEVLKDIEKEIENHSKNKKQIETEIEKLSLGIKNYIEKQQELEKFFYIEQDYNRKMQELENLKNRNAEIESEMFSLKTEIESIKKETYNYEELLKKGSELNEKLEKEKEELMKIRMKKPFEVVERDINLEIGMKKREIEQAERNMKQARQESMELNVKLKDIIKDLESRSKELAKKMQEQEAIERRFKKFLDEKSDLQKQNHEFEVSINEKQMNKTLTDGELNEFKIEKARIGASLSVLETEFNEYQGLELFDKSLNEIESRLIRYEEQFKEIGTVNLRALEVYDRVKQEYEEVNIKVIKLEEEKQEILKIIAEIDKKKKKSFMQTLNQINESFTKNYSMLTKKGVAFLDLENKEDPFADGLNIIIKLGKGKYMESELLSGGEKVIVALALIFAIQKYRPYSFYIFDEIDAALDKVNSEILAGLIKENIKNSQYLMISHNDVVISNADILYGTSMQEGITKVFSLRV